MNNKSNEKKKKGFKMPHIMWIMLSLVIIVCALTYIVPAGTYAVDADGKILVDQFEFLDEQTPVDPWTAVLKLIQGFQESATIIAVIFMSSAMTVVVISTGAMDNFLNWSIFKLKDKNQNILITCMFFLMVYIGAFAGSDSLIAIVPVGIMFAKKMNLDLVSGLLFSIFPSMIGMGTSPTCHVITQLLLGVRLYGAFVTIFIIMNVFAFVGLLMVKSYVKKIQADPTKSLTHDIGWGKYTDNEVSNVVIKEAKMSVRDILVMVLYFSHFIFVIVYPFISDGSYYAFLVAIYLIVAIVCGLVGGQSMNKLATNFSKGIQDVAFIAFLVSVARLVSIIMAEGNIIHSVVHFMTEPLSQLPASVAAVGMSSIVSFVDLFITSVVSKSSLMVPIYEPLSQALGIYEYIILLVFQLGDSFTKLITPFGALIVSSCAVADVPFERWVKWALPKVLIFLAMSYGIIFLLSTIGWSAF